MRKIIYFLFVFLYSYVSLLNAQTGILYSTDKELSSSLINSIYQDKRNYIWIATEDGLNKFDGVRFNVYKNVQGDSTTIKNNYVKTLFEDSFGRFWIGCINGLHLYNRDIDEFSEIKLFNEGIQITPHITSIIESKDNEIWMTTSGLGIIRIKETRKDYHTDIELSTRLSSKHLTDVYQDIKGNFWIASENHGLNMYNPVTDEVKVFKEPYSIGSNQISSICEDGNGNLLVGTLNNGLYRLNSEISRFESIPHVRNEVLSVKSLLLDKKNRLLVATDGQGMKIYNNQKNCLEDFYISSASFDFSRTKVHSVFQDNGGNIWIGLFQKGVFLTSENNNRFNYWGHKSFTQDIIGSGCVMSLTKDREQSLWIGTDNDGIYKIDNAGYSRHFASNSVPGTVLSMVEDDLSEGFWIGSYLKGLAFLNKETGHCTYYNNNIDQDKYNTARDKIFCIAKDFRGQLWIGTNGAGVYVFDLKKRIYVAHYSQLGVGQYQIPNNWINSILCSRDGSVWIGSYDGVSNINPSLGQVETYTEKDRTLPGSVIYYIMEDSKDNIWIGTTEGLVCLDKQNHTTKIYTIADGLPSDVICGLLEDNQGNIWISTHAGISKFLIEDKRFINYYAFDGLQGNEFSMGAVYKSDAGEMFFGGINGVSSFMPSDVDIHRLSPHLYLTGLYILDQLVVAGQKSGKHEIISGFIADADTIHLNYRDNMFALEFSTFDFGGSGRVSYLYMLEGLNSQWMKTEQGTNRINFTNLDYGTYRLRVKALVYNDSSDEKVITLIITPPWYLTWWAKLLYFVFFVSLIWGIAKFVIDRIQHKNELIRREHIEQISEAKLQFFINVSHEIRTPMTLIISPLEKLIRENKDGAAQKVYLLMYRNAQRILNLINQLMDVRKIDKGLMSVRFRETDIVGFIYDVIHIFEYQSKKKDIRLNFVHVDLRLNAWIDLNNFDKVLVNILSNAFKFTPEGGEITISLKTGKNRNESGPLSKYFEVIVSDTGIGIEEGNVEKIFERFYQVDNNLNEFNFGTGIGLHLARSLVNMQYGTIYAKNREDKRGAEFIIRLPLGDIHLMNSEKERGENEIESQIHDMKNVIPYNDEDEVEHRKVKPKTKYRVLIVDDEDEIRHYLRHELSDIYKVDECVNGKQALDFILKEKPTLVVSDIMMPQMDGITLCKKIKSNININHIPVVLLTAKASDEAKAEGFDIGADAYIAKPFNIDLLKRQIASIIENRERLEHKTGNLDEAHVQVKPVILRSSDQILYEKIIKIIDENISNPELNVELLADGVGMSRVHMHRKLKELTNQSARDFIRGIRLKQASELLSGQKLSVSEVAYALGFNNLSHFSNTFREFYGMSPREYAEKNTGK